MLKLYVKSNREERKKLIELMEYFDKWILCYQESNPVIKEEIAQLNDKDKNDLLLRMKKQRNKLKELLVDFEREIFHKEADEIKSEYREILHQQCIMRRMFCIYHIDYREIEKTVPPFHRDGISLLNLTDGLSNDIETIQLRNSQMLNILYDYSPYNPKLNMMFRYGSESDNRFYKKYYAESIRLVQLFDPDKEWFLKRMRRLNHFYQTGERRKVKLRTYY